MYSHRSRHREQPIWLHSDNRTLAGYWEINGVKAHCLLDSRSEGVLLSLEFMWAMGIKMFALEQPIALQLACIGSRSMINYRTHVSIKIGHKVVEEYFDIMNIEHYDMILGTPFRRKMGIVLDIRSPGIAWIGNEVIPTRKGWVLHSSLQICSCLYVWTHVFVTLHHHVGSAPPLAAPLSLMKPQHKHVTTLCLGVACQNLLKSRT